MTCRRAVQLAHYRCSRCQHEWREPPSWKIACPNCGELYVKWTNYDHSFARPTPRAIGTDAEDPPSASGAEPGSSVPAAMGPGSPISRRDNSGGDVGSPSTLRDARPSGSAQGPAASLSGGVDIPCESDPSRLESPATAD